MEASKNGERGSRGERGHEALTEPLLQDFCRERNIRTEDFGLIAELAAFPKELVILSAHNIFNTHKEESGNELERYIAMAQSGETKLLYETLLAFYKKYDWAASYHLVRVLERLGERDGR